jgi:hypothetical protein
LRRDSVMKVRLEITEVSGGFDNCLKERNDHTLADYLARECFGSV